MEHMEDYSRMGSTNTDNVQGTIHKLLSIFWKIMKPNFNNKKNTNIQRSGIS